MLSRTTWRACEIENMRLQGKRAVITGAANGIGRAIATTMSREGAAVVLADIDSDRGQEVVETIRSADGQAEFIRTDVTDSSEVASLVEQAAAALNGIDTWVNNAGSSLTEDLLEIEPDQWRDELRLNLESHFLTSREVLPTMIASGGGSLVNVSSVNALWAIGETGYSAAKAGLISLTKNIAVRYGRDGIRANVICPGTIGTQRCLDYWQQKAGALEKLLPWYPLQRLGDPEDVAWLAIFLASDESAFITGATIPVDGGLTAGSPLFGTL
ncbi:MAG: SDR family NAD(P)-dependent oxidoreductase [Planctomycetaceae bacterium]|nr:SDR family NAD(P)-dependent oxidoreductase [Planctomycetaceae bacterium]